MGGRRGSRSVAARPLGSFDLDRPEAPEHHPPPESPPAGPPPQVPPPSARPRLEEDSIRSLEERQHRWIRERLRAERTPPPSTEAPADSPG